MRDQYLLNMQFAEELLRFLKVKGPTVLGYKTLWGPDFDICELKEKIGISLFHEEVGWCVLNIMYDKVYDIEACFRDICDEIIHEATNFVDAETFSKYALKAVPLFFSEGYNHGAFLGFCAMVLGVAYHFLYLKPSRIPKTACQVIALVLFMHQMTGEFYEEGGWQAFSRVAFNFNNYIQESRKK